MRHYPARQPRSPAGHWSPRRDRAAQAAFRKAVIALYGDSCIRCGARPVQAHHTQPGNDDPATGLPLCQHHHKLEDPHAR